MTKTTRQRLPNGLTLLHEELHHAPVVALQAWVNVGSADETDAISGIAHLHEHMLFKGTERRGVGEIARTVEAAGGEINAWTSFDQTVYHLVMPAGELATGVDILADALCNSAFDAAELEREIEVVVEEIQRAKDSPARRASNALFALAYQAHPYRRPVLGTEESVRGFTRDGILQFFRSHYRPDNITFVAVGDFQPDALRAEVERCFGAWQPTGAPPAATRAVEPEQKAVRVQVLREAVKESHVSVAWHIPEVRHDDIAALDALSMVLGYGDSARLYVETRRRLGLCNDVYAHAYTPRDPGLFMVGASLRSECTLPALHSVLEETYRLRHQPVGDAELEKVRVVLQSEAAYQRETMQGEARKLGFYEVVAGDHAFEGRYMEALKRLQPADLCEAAERYLSGAPTVVAQIPEETVGVDDAALQQTVADAFAKGRRVPKGARKKGELGVTRVELESGATLLVASQPDSPVIGLRAAALGGLRWENGHNCGLGNIFGSVWGLATQDSPPDVFARRSALLGGSVSSFAGRNSVGLRGEFIAEKAASGLELFCDALMMPAFGETDLERERAAILERIRNREDHPAVVCYEHFASLLYPAHPYGMSILGTLENVQGFGIDDVQAYWQRFLSPDKLVLAVVGNIDEEGAIDTLVERLSHGEPLPRPELVAADLPPDAARYGKRPLDKQQAHIMVGAMGTTVDNADRHALEVLTTVLSGQSGRLFLDLRDRQSLAYSVSSSNLEGLDPGHIVVHIATSPEKTGQAIGGIRQHLGQLRREPVGDEELARAKRYLVGTHAIDLQRCGARAMTMALHELFGMGYDAHRHYPEQIRAVTADDVMRVACTYLDEPRLVEAVVGPE